MLHEPVLLEIAAVNCGADFYEELPASISTNSAYSLKSSGVRSFFSISFCLVQQDSSCKAPLPRPEQQMNLRRQPSVAAVGTHRSTIFSLPALPRSQGVLFSSAAVSAPIINHRSLSRLDHLQVASQIRSSYRRYTEKWEGTNM